MKLMLFVTLLSGIAILKTIPNIVNGINPMRRKKQLGTHEKISVMILFDQI
jgi:hypothetical protein